MGRVFEDLQFDEFSTQSPINPIFHSFSENIRKIILTLIPPFKGNTYFLVPPLQTSIHSFFNGGIPH